jgi:hypothetical protein
VYYVGQDSFHVETVLYLSADFVLGMVAVHVEEDGSEIVVQLYEV